MQVTSQPANKFIKVKHKFNKNSSNDQAKTQATLKLYRVFNLTSNAFWPVKGMYFCLVMGCIVGLCAASNISLLWIEISANTELKILPNVKKTKPALVCLFLSLNSLCIILAIIYNCNCSYAVAVLIFYLLCALIAFGIGARRVSKMFHCRFANSVTGARRNEAKTAEISPFMVL